MQENAITLYLLVVTKGHTYLKKPSALSMYELLLPTDLKGLKMIWNILMISKFWNGQNFLIINKKPPKYFNSKININFVNRNSIESKVTIFVSPVAECQRWIQEFKNSAASRMVHIATELMTWNQQVSSFLEKEVPVL